MATFVSTTLAKRTGATTTTFNPSGKSGDSGILTATSTYTNLAPELVISSKGGGGKTRISKVKVTVPQIYVDSGNGLPLVKSRPYCEIVLVIPAGTLQTDVNDLVGYLESALSTGKANLNSLLVGGEGVY